MEKPKIAIVCDWLTNMGGAENVVLAFHEAFPDAPIYTSTFEPSAMPAFKGLDVRTTYLQRLPRPLRKLHKFMPIFRVQAFRKLDLSDFDIILSSSSAESKQIKKTRSDQIHICYCHTPIRYYWSHYDEYKKDPGFGKMNWLVRFLMTFLVPHLKNADYDAAQKVDVFLANSNTTKARVKRYYKRDAITVFPPVNTTRFSPTYPRKDFYVAMSRQVPYKRIDLAIQAANALKIPLRVFGDGSEHNKLVAMAGPTVTFHPGTPSPKDQTFITKSLSEAKGFIFPAEEDFGITPVEAIAAGAPVIAYGKGGVTDIVEDGKTGVLFDEQTVDSVIAGIQRAEKIAFTKKSLNDGAARFDNAVFRANIKRIVHNSQKAV